MRNEIQELLNGNAISFMNKVNKTLSEKAYVTESKSAAKFVVRILYREGSAASTVDIPADSPEEAIKMWEAKKLKKDVFTKVGQAPMNPDKWVLVPRLYPRATDSNTVAYRK